MKIVKIKTIKKLEDVRHVYDLNVSSNHNFFIGKTDTLTSNCDFLTTNAQASLRNILETYSLNTRFILTANYKEKLLPAIISRCQVFEIIPPSKKEIAIHLKNILDKEKITYTAENIVYVVSTYHPDIRKMINFVQQSSITGELKIVKSNTGLNDLKSSILELIKKYNSPSTFNDIRQLIADNNVQHYEDLYQSLYDDVSYYAAEKETIIILTIAEYLYQSSMVVNREITYMACISKILKELAQ